MSCDQKVDYQLVEKLIGNTSYAELQGCYYKLTLESLSTCVAGHFLSIAGMRRGVGRGRILRDLVIPHPRPRR